MSERENQAGDAEQAVCHVCAERFGTQVELAKHLMEAHPQDALQAGPGADDG